MRLWLCWFTPVENHENAPLMVCLGPVAIVALPAARVKHILRRCAVRALQRLHHTYSVAPTT